MINKPSIHTFWDNWVAESNYKYSSFWKHKLGNYYLYQWIWGTLTSSQLSVVIYGMNFFNTLEWQLMHLTAL